MQYGKIWLVVLCVKVFVLYALLCVFVNQVDVRMVRKEGHHPI